MVAKLVHASPAFDISVTGFTDSVSVQVPQLAASQAKLILQLQSNGMLQESLGDEYFVKQHDRKTRQRHVVLSFGVGISVK
jgi:hypothetical protein